MRKKTDLTPVLLGISAVVQAILLTAVWVVQDLTGKKAGVNHHLQFQKTAWMHRYLTDRNLLILTVVLAAAAVVLLVLLRRKGTAAGKPAAVSAVLALIWCGAGLYSLYSPAVQAKLVYPYLMMAEGLCLLLSLLPFGVGIARSGKRT